MSKKLRVDEERFAAETLRDIKRTVEQFREKLFDMEHRWAENVAMKLNPALDSFDDAIRETLAVIGAKALDIERDKHETDS